MDERIISMIGNCTAGLILGLAFSWLSNRTTAKLFAALAILARKHEALQEQVKELSDHVTDTSNLLFEEFANIEEKVVMVHQDILYLDQDLDEMEERVIRLEYRPGKPEAQTIEAQAVPAPSMIRRRRQFSRMRRHGT